MEVENRIVQWSLSIPVFYLYSGFRLYWSNSSAQTQKLPANGVLHSGFRLYRSLSAAWKVTGIERLHSMAMSSQYCTFSVQALL